jgi:hypothetical protein
MQANAIGDGDTRTLWGKTVAFRNDMSTKPLQTIAFMYNVHVMWRGERINRGCSHDRDKDTPPRRFFDEDDADLDDAPMAPMRRYEHMI